MKKTCTSIFTKSESAPSLHGETVAVDPNPGISKLSNPKGGISLTSLVKATVLAAASFALPQLQPLPVQAQQVPQEVINGLFSPTGAERFFLEGQRQFDREIQIIIDNRLSFPDSLLEIDDALGRQQIENHHLQLDDNNSFGLRQSFNINEQKGVRK